MGRRGYCRILEMAVARRCEIGLCVWLEDILQDHLVWKRSAKSGPNCEVTRTKTQVEGNQEIDPTSF